MNELEKQYIIESTIKTWMSDDEVTIEESIHEADELTNTKVAIMSNMLQEVDKQKLQNKKTLRDLYANKIVLEIDRKISFLLQRLDKDLSYEEYTRLLSIINTYIIELRKDKKTLNEIKRAIIRLASVQTLQCNSRLMLLLQLLEDKRVSMVENYNYEHTMAESSLNGITYVSNKDVEDRTKEINKNILTLRLSLGLMEE